MQQIDVINNDLVYNASTGLVLSSSATSSPLVFFGNNIVWENHDLTPARNGLGLYATTPNEIYVTYNLFQGNGPSDTSPAYAGANIGGGFNPNILGPIPDGLGNIAGAPAFVSPRNPLPGADGPGVFFNDANFDLTLPSAAINTALNSVAPTYDFLYRTAVAISGRGRFDSGPADIGAFYYQGTSSSTLSVTTTSLAPGGTMFANGYSILSSNAPNSIIVHFSQAVMQSSVTVSDLILSGSGISPSNPAHATSLDWIDSETVQFNLSGNFASSGVVDVTVPAGSFYSASNVPVSGFQDSVTLVPPPVTNPTGGTTTVPVVVTAPPAATAPTTFGPHPIGKVAHHHKTVVRHKPVVHHSVAKAAIHTAPASSQKKKKH